MPARHVNPAAPRAATRPQRIGGVDTLRGIAICLMVGYHFAFDLNYYGVLRADFEHDLVWQTLRAVIVTSFLTLVGISIVLATRAAMPTSRYLRRVGIIGVAALATSIGSWLVFPGSFIYFGILHCIALASLAGWLLRRHPGAALTLAIAVLAAGLTYTNATFDQRAWSWVGFVTHKPVTEDYVPLFPWSAAVFGGIALGHALVRARVSPLARLDPAPDWLRWLGRHSLAIYLVHQPLLLGLLWLLVR